MTAQYIFDTLPNGTIRINDAFTTICVATISPTHTPAQRKMAEEAASLLRKAAEQILRAD